MSEPVTPSKRDYAKAKARYEGWTAKQHAKPTADMLADVATINAYEQAADADST